MKQALTIAAILGLALASGSLTSCNTVYGMGQDLSTFGTQITGSGTVQGMGRDLENFGQGVGAVFDPNRQVWIYPRGQVRRGGGTTVGVDRYGRPMTSGGYRMNGSYAYP